MTKDVYTNEYLYRNIKVTSNLNGYYEQHIECPPSEIIKINHNHRRIFINCVIWDVDVHIRLISNKIHDFISSNLIKDNISHQVWDTSRSPHIHCFFNGLNLYPQEARKDIKLLILKHYSGKYFNWIDKSKASENNMIRDFNAVHEITGKRKALIYEYINPQNTLETPLNPIPAIILEQLRVLYLSYKKDLNLSENKLNANPEETKQMNEFVDFCLSHRFAKGCRHQYIFKHIAFIMCILQYTDKQVKEVSRIIARNNVETPQYEIYSWWKWLKQRKHPLKFNWNRVREYYAKEHIF